jgi:ParB-like chromosome segregation protein Spo0J
VAPQQSTGLKTKRPLTHGADWGPHFLSFQETDRNFTSDSIFRESASVAPVQPSSILATGASPPDPPPDALRLTPQPILPKIASVKIQTLRLHPAVRALRCNPTAVELEPVRQNWQAALAEPLTVTRRGTIIDGNKRWAVALEHRVSTLPCLILAISNDEALDQILARAATKNWLNRYRRIRLALTLEEALRNRARENQRAGGRKKGPSTLTKAQQIDVRREIAQKAGASTGSVTKVKQILAAGSPLLKQEAQRDGISIDAAWRISKFDHDEQKRQLGRRASERRGRKRTRDLARAAHNGNAPVGPNREGRVAQIGQLLDEITRSGPLAKFRDQVRELLAYMERELDAYDSTKAKPNVSDPTDSIAQAG